MTWRIIIAVILFIISVAGILFTGSLLLKLIDEIFDIH